MILNYVCLVATIGLAINTIYACIYPITPYLTASEKQNPNSPDTLRKKKFAIIYDVGMKLFATLVTAAHTANGFRYANFLKESRNVKILFPKPI